MHKNCESLKTEKYPTSLSKTLNFFTQTDINKNMQLSVEYYAKFLVDENTKTVVKQTVLPQKHYLCEQTSTFHNYT